MKVIVSDYFTDDSEYEQTIVIGNQYVTDVRAPISVAAPKVHELITRHFAKSTKPIEVDIAYKRLRPYWIGDR